MDDKLPRSSARMFASAGGLIGLLSGVLGAYTAYNMPAAQVLGDDRGNLPPQAFEMIRVGAVVLVPMLATAAGALVGAIVGLVVSIADRLTHRRSDRPT